MSSGEPVEIMTVAGELTFSSVPGFRLGDFNTECAVVPGRQCPEKIARISMYTSNVIETADGVPEGATTDLFKLDIKLREHDIYARVTSPSCAEAAQDACPTRQAMNENKVRQTGVWTVRKFMSVFKTRGH